MKFNDFSLSFSHITRGEALFWSAGTPHLQGTANALAAKVLSQLPWAVSVNLELKSQEKFSDEGYELDIKKECVHLAAASQRGLLYGAWSLIRFGELEEKFECHIIDTPQASRRGLKLYLPPPDAASLKEFYAIIDLAVRYKYNFVMLELGGAMEYKSHPEINEAYLKYASFMNEYPAKAMKLQHSFSWSKNSIHTDNGGGLILSQQLLKEIIAFCEERELEIIPEVPSLSHCDYILAAHPELAERKEDPYPDTACPAKEEYYTLLFDLLKETVDLFHPKRINIGHDEYYSIGLCPECSKKSAPQIYAGDINRTAAFLKGLGVGTIIWGDKLLNAHFLTGSPCGGAEIPAGSDGFAGVPATYPAIDMIDEEVEIFHWYWSIARELDQEYDTRGMKYLFGNFGAVELPDWTKRSSAKNFQGVCVSNWGRSDYETVRRNGILFDLICSSCLCWNCKIGSEDYTKLLKMASEELLQLNRNRLGAGTPVFEITHTVDTGIEFLYFFDGNFIVESDFLLGDHVYCTDSGEEYTFPVIFGKNISNAVNSPGRICDPLSDFDRYVVNRQYIEILGGAEPFRDTDGRMWYKTVYPHPAPGKKLIYKEFRIRGRHNCRVSVKEQ